MTLHSIVSRKIREAGAEAEFINFERMAYEIFTETGYKIDAEQLETFHRLYFKEHRPSNRRKRGGRSKLHASLFELVGRGK